MSLVGSEVDVPGGSTSSSSPRAVKKLLPYRDVHAPPSPKRPAEALFLGSDLSTDSISAAALAQQIHLQHRRSPAATSVATDDFLSTSQSHHSSRVEQMNTSNHTSNHDHEDGPRTSPSFNDEEEDVSSSLDSPSPRDPLLQNFQDTSTPKSIEEEFVTPKQSTEDFASLKIPSEDVAPPKNPIEELPIANNNSEALEEDSTMAVSVENKEELHVDPACNTYHTAKGVWSWGKGVFIFRPFLGIAEGVAGKVVQIVGSSLPDVDKTVEDKLHGIDDGILNPAIRAIVGILLGASDKTQDVLKPIFNILLKPLGMIKNKAEHPEKPNSPPALTTKAR